ncbi:Putrescine oxidase [Mycobacterium basiliense]|uniref:Putrescine oxidase n=1 Tax=Mycobacterium basiliense TaxID=2094119 RepID=A0A3S4C045_9MYCO|nr:NAD(P)/FAD-dependent oxidoreductase [Mycobacterium basiliense]VDM91052.1 Putrescine oxidase [Mycobacterium basiliense]
MVDRRFEVLRDGLIPRPGRHRSVVVVGAGISGVVCARLLHDAGYEVQVLEARDRAGGRLWAVDGVGGQYYELGGMRFSESNQLAMEVFRQAGVTVSPFPLQHKSFFFGGRHFHPDGFLPSSAGFDIPPEDDRPLTELLDRVMAPVNAIYERQDNDEEEAFFECLDRFDRYSIQTWLTERGLSPGAVNCLSLVNNIEGRLNFSFSEWAEYVRVDAFGPNLLYVEEGTTELMRRLVEPIAHLVRFGVQATRIEQSLSTATVHWRAGGREGSIRADEVILAVPPIVLRHIPIEGMSTAKDAALRRTYCGRAAKVFLRFNRRWWDDIVGDKGGLAVTDLPVRNVLFTVAGQGDDPSRGAIIGSYTWESDSMVFANLPVEERIERVLSDVELMYPEAVGSFEGGVAHDWGSDRWAGGVGGLFRPTEMSGDHYRDLIEPLGRVWFAGETYDRRSRRWVEGALKSAVKNCMALHDNARDNLPLD